MNFEMTRKFADRICDELYLEGIEASSLPNYSGRFMCGNTVVGIVVKGRSTSYNIMMTALRCAIDTHWDDWVVSNDGDGGSESLLKFIDEVKPLVPTRHDNMGIDIIFY